MGGGGGGLVGNVPKILDLKSSSEQIFSEYSRLVPLNKVMLVTLIQEQ